MSSPDILLIRIALIAVTVLAILLFASLMCQWLQSSSRELLFVVATRASRRAESSRQLDQALDRAVRLSAKINPRIETHLGSAIRYCPSGFDAATRKVLEFYLQDYVVSVDLSNLTEQEAIKLVDFCTGVVGVTQGWMFRPSGNVIMIGRSSRMSDVE